MLCIFLYLKRRRRVKEIASIDKTANIKQEYKTINSEFRRTIAL